MFYIPTNFTFSRSRQLIRLFLMVSGLICVAFGFTQSLDSETDRTLWVIDNSLSMAVEDISTQSGVLLSRLDRAKEIVASGSSNIHNEQAVMTAAYGGKLEVPMTTDVAILSDIIHGITVLGHGGGSSVMMSLEMMRLIYGNTPHLSIVWITDGEFSDVGGTLSGWTLRPNITLIGVGTRSGGPILMGYDMDGHPRYKESGGVRINSIRDDDRLTTIADSLGARLILLDGQARIDISDIVKNTDPDRIIPYLMILGIILTIFGLIISRFHFSKKLNGCSK